MTSIESLHLEAMECAASADDARRLGRTREHGELICRAYDLERQAAMLLVDSTLQPTRSVLFRSAASLAIESGNQRQAMHLIQLGLSGGPPSEIAAELKALATTLSQSNQSQNTLDTHSLPDRKDRQSPSPIPMRSMVIRRAGVIVAAVVVMFASFAFIGTSVDIDISTILTYLLPLVLICAIVGTSPRSPHTTDRDTVDKRTIHLPDSTTKQVKRIPARRVRKRKRR